MAGNFLVRYVAKDVNFLNVWIHLLPSSITVNKAELLKNNMEIFAITRSKLAALYSATKSLQNSCTAKLQLFSSLLEAKQQLHSSCSGMQKRCAAFEGSLKLSAAVRCV